MKTYRINKNAARLAQGTGFAPELVYNISLVRFQGRNGRYIAAWTPGMKRPRYVYKARTPEEYDKAMECIRQEAERFRRHDEAQEKAAAAFRESLRVGDILYSSWGWEQTNRPTEARPTNYRRRLYVRNDRPTARCFQGHDPYAPPIEKLYPHRLLPHRMEMGRAAPAVQLVRITLH